MTREGDSDGEMSHSTPEICGENEEVCVDDSTTHKRQVNDENIIQPSSLMNRHETSKVMLGDAQNQLSLATFVVLCVSLILVSFFMRQKRQQREWEKASNIRLKEISQRNMQANNSHIPKQEDKSVMKLEPTHDDATNRSSSGTCSTIHIDRIRSIRSQQQTQNDTKSKLAKQQKRLAEKEKKRLVYESFQHDLADQAHERRKNVIKEEQEILKAAAQEAIISNNDVDDAEEMERRELLRVQNLEYEESLRHDQERSMQAAIEVEMSRKRAAMLRGALHRLRSAGIYTPDLPISALTMDEADVEINASERIQLRLMLPCGRRVHATYLKHHTIGLIYDLALIVLNYKQHDQVFIQAREYIQEEQHASIQEETRYNVRDRSEWKELFDVFTVKATFPPQTFGSLDKTLEQCGLEQSVALMVIVESDS